ncbi:hypothetical protein ACEPPZ_20300, partial [Paracoccus yeei]
MTTPPKTNDGKTAAAPGQPDAVNPVVARAEAVNGGASRPFSGAAASRPVASARPVRPFEGQNRPPLSQQAPAAKPQGGALATRPIPVQPMAQPAQAPLPAARPAPGQPVPAGPGGAQTT